MVALGFASYLVSHDPERYPLRPAAMAAHAPLRVVGTILGSADFVPGRFGPCEEIAALNFTKTSAWTRPKPGAART